MERRPVRREMRRPGGRRPRSRQITGNLAMPGFYGAEAAVGGGARARSSRGVGKVLLPKDYLRYRLSGDYVAEMSDASGEPVAGRRQPALVDEMLAATGLGREHMPAWSKGRTVGRPVA